MRTQHSLAGSSSPQGLTDRLWAAYSWLTRTLVEQGPAALPSGSSLPKDTGSAEGKTGSLLSPVLLSWGCGAKKGCGGVRRGPSPAPGRPAGAELSWSRCHTLRDDRCLWAPWDSEGLGEAVQERSDAAPSAPLWLICLPDARGVPLSSYVAWPACSSSLEDRQGKPAGGPKARQLSDSRPSLAGRVIWEDPSASNDVFIGTRGLKSTTSTQSVSKDFMRCGRCAYFVAG